ncbi:hypothetical protein Tco_0190355 [Tanacetum coccineum]
MFSQQGGDEMMIWRDGVKSRARAGCLFDCKRVGGFVLEREKEYIKLIDRREFKSSNLDDDVMIRKLCYVAAQKAERATFVVEKAEQDKRSVIISTPYIETSKITGTMQKNPLSSFRKNCLCTILDEINMNLLDIRKPEPTGLL